MKDQVRGEEVIEESSGEKERMKAKGRRIAGMEEFEETRLD